MLQVENETPFKVALAVFPDAEGVDTLYVTVRGAFDVRDSLRIADEQPAIRAADEYFGEPETSSLKYAGEMQLLKPSTDVVLVGHACAVGGRPVPIVDVALAVASVRKTIRVFGDREWKGLIDPTISPPAPFERLPLVYERSFGGVVGIDPEARSVQRDPRNPVGMGFARVAKSGEMGARQLPNLEDPAQLIQHPSDRPAPAGFGFVAPSWEPRRSFAGTYDHHWKKTRAPFLPADFNPQFFNSAHPDLICKGHLQGGEEVSVLHVTPAPGLHFRLPTCRFDTRVFIGNVIEKPPLFIETVLLEPDEHRVSLLWRGALRCDKSALRVSRVRVQMTSLELAGRAA